MDPPKYICFNNKSEFQVLTEKTEIKAKEQCLDISGCFLGSEEEVQKKINILLGMLTKKSIAVDQTQLDIQIKDAEKRMKENEDPEDMDTAQSLGYAEGRLDTLNEIKNIPSSQ